jgi:hypothetical protein
VDSGPQPQPQKGVQVGGRTLAGTQPSFLIWYTNEWTGLRPYLGISGGLKLSQPTAAGLCGITRLLGQDIRILYAEGNQ